MTTYFDSGIIAKLYCPEADSQVATALVASRPAGQPIWELQELETRNAIRLKVRRAEILPAEAAKGLQGLSDDTKVGLWRRCEIAWSNVAAMAEQLSADHAVGIGCRSLDILHVAAALELKVLEFVTGDLRQHQLAAAAGLRVVHYSPVAR